MHKGRTRWLGLCALGLLATTAATRANSCGTNYASNSITESCWVGGICEQWVWQKNVYCKTTTSDTRCINAGEAQENLTRTYGAANCAFGVCYNWEFVVNTYPNWLKKTDNCGVSMP